MYRNSRSSAGFSVIEGMIVLTVMVLLGTVGCLVYRNSHKLPAATAPQATMKATSPSTFPKLSLTGTNAYSGWSSYAGNNVSFKYPTGWLAGYGPDKYTAIDIRVMSPGFTSSALSTDANPGAPITMSLQLSTDSAMAPSCLAYTCQVVAAVPLNNNVQLPDSSLAVVNQTSTNGTNFSQYAVVSNTTKVGDKTIQPLSYGSNSLYIFGQPYYTPKDGGLTVAARVTDAAALQADVHFKDLVSLINSITFN